MTTPAAEETDAGTSADDGISFRIPEVILSLGLDLPPQERAEHIRDMAGQVWAAGTDFQRETTAELYGEIAEGAAEDGALYAGVCFLALDDGRPASASLVVRSEETDRTDAEIVASGIVEGLSTQPGKEAYRTTAAGRPVAVVFSMVNPALDGDGDDDGDGDGDATTPAGAVPAPRESTEAAQLSQPTQPAAPAHRMAPAADAQNSPGAEAPVVTVASAEAYVPLPEIAQLLVLCISTPTPEIFPDLVTLLSGITETLEVTAPDAAVPPETRAGDADQEGPLRPSRIMEI